MNDKFDGAHAQCAHDAVQTSIFTTALYGLALKLLVVSSFMQIVMDFDKIGIQVLFVAMTSTYVVKITPMMQNVLLDIVLCVLQRKTVIC